MRWQFWKKTKEASPKKVASISFPKEGYCQLEIGGKYRTLVFSMRFWEILCRTLNINLKDLSEYMSSKGATELKAIRDMVYSALVAADKQEDKKAIIDYSNFDVGLWLPQISNDDMDMIIHCFAETKFFANDMNMGISRIAKKSTKDPNIDRPLTFELLRDYYNGQVGMSAVNFWNATWKDVLLTGEQWQINHNLEWERLRYLSATVLNAKAEKRSQLIRPDKLFKLPQDVYLKKGEPASSKESFEKFMEICRKKGIPVGTDN